MGLSFAGDNVSFFLSSSGSMKYFLPEGVKTSLTISMNLREFIAMYSLRSQPNVLDEFRLLVFEMRRVLPLVLQELV